MLLRAVESLYRLYRRGRLTFFRLRHRNRQG
jgi:hypothetical protein